MDTPQAMPATRLVAVDMDGTFLDSSGSYDRARFARLVPRLREAGITFVTASGNQYWQLQKHFEGFPDVLYVAENGALVGDAETVWDTSPISPAAAWSAIEVLDQMAGLVVLVCGPESAFALSNNTPDVLALLRRYYTRLQVVDSWADASTPVLKLALACPPDQTSRLLRRFAVELPDELTPMSSGHGSIDLIRHDVSKATGLRQIGERLGIDPSAMIAFGDGGNDLAMLEYVGTSIAMANAPADVRAVADAVTGTNDDAGVLDYLETMLRRH